MHINNIFQEIKARITCVEYANILGWNINKSGDRTYSLDKGENKTCLAVYNDYWIDYKTGLSGDVIDLCAITKHDGNKSDALNELCEMLSLGKHHGSNQWKEYTQNLCNTIQLWHTKLRDEDREYLRKRNISQETITTLKIGYNNDRLIIPYYKNGYVSYYIGRTTTNHKKKYLKPKLDGMNENTLWGLHTLKRQQKELYLTEGAFDAITLDQENKSVLATMGGFFSKEQLRQLYSICLNFEEIIICLDTDKTGQSNTLKLAKIFLSKKINFSVIELKNEKDISDYYAKNKNIDFINDKINGLKYITNKITDKEKFKDFIKSIARYTSKTLLVDLFELVKDNFPKEWLKTLKSQAFTCPTEFMIVNEIVKKYKLKYHPQLGFFEYENGYWKRKEDETIQMYIHLEFGYYSTGNKVSSTCKLLKVTTSTENLFNKQPVINFKNGILHIDSGEFKPHNESYLTTIQLSCDYLPEEKPQKWLKFLNDITNNDQPKIDIIQEMFGYILFNDCCLQKCFILMGNGGDGKSKLLDVVKMLFGDENISTVEMSCLAEPFQRISLLNSMVNISSETSTNVSQASQIFKQIVTGDSINACYKGKDFVTFTSRAKMILATNDQLNTQDMSKGMDRRLIFIQFPMSFCDNPIYDNERKADRYITDKLKGELPAIFNWAYDGYKRLKLTLSFTETEEQEAIKQEFRELNNPVYNFINDYVSQDSKMIPSFFTTKDLYSEYKKWSTENGRNQMNYINFSRKMRNTIENFYQDKIAEKRKSNLRGYEIIPF